VDWVFVLAVVPRRRKRRCDWLAAALAAFTPAFEAEGSLRDEKLEGSRIINPSTTTTFLVHAHDNLNLNHCSHPRLLAIVQLPLNPLGHFSFTGASLPLHQNGTCSQQPEHQHRGAYKTTNGDISINHHDVSRHQDLLVSGSLLDG
jgi:hypothetical protein